MSNALPTRMPVTGYYRYTDIVYEWHKCLDPSVTSPLKAFLSPNCLTSPENPLRKEGLDGIDLTMGVLLNNESRLLFTSAQIEYIRYWLKAMGYTPELVSLPNSSYLIRADQLSVNSPAVYSTGAELKKALKDMTKLNKRVKDVDSGLADMRITFEKVRTHIASKKGVWCAMDFEAWEGVSNYVTEVGLATLKWEAGVEKIETEHWIVKNAPRNGVYVEDNRDHFLFGKSEEIPKPALPERVTSLIKTLSEQGPLYLVFHDYKGDFKYLYSMGFETASISLTLPETVPDSGIFCVDTVKLFSALEGNKEPMKLERIVRLLGVKNARRFHNAGNDAHFTLQAMKAMATGPPVDLQREERWPPAPIVEGLPTPKRSVRREPGPEDDSDFEDTEAILGGY